MIRPAIFATYLLLTVTQATVAKEYAVFDIIGDSISRGVNPETTGDYGWADILFGDSAPGIPAHTNTLFSLWPEITNYNSAVSGSTAGAWASDAQGRLTAVKNRHPNLVVVYIGGNDLLDSIQDGFVSADDMELYRDHLTSIITNLQQITPVPDIILMTYYDPFDGFSSNLNGTLSHLTNATMTTMQANEVIREVASSNDCYLIDTIRAGFFHHGYGEELGDTGHIPPSYFQQPLTDFDVHPVTAGHETLYEIVYEKLRYLKEYGVPESWLAQFGLTSYTTDASLDQDNDGALTWQEYAAGTIPTNQASVFTASLQYPVISWTAAENRRYGLSWSTNLTEDFIPMASNLTGNTYTDTVHQSEDRIYYRLDVRLDAP